MRRPRIVKFLDIPSNLLEAPISTLHTLLKHELQFYTMY